MKIVLTSLSKGCIIKLLQQEINKNLNKKNKKGYDYILC